MFGQNAFLLYELFFPIVETRAAAAGPRCCKNVNGILDEEYRPKILCVCVCCVLSFLAGTTSMCAGVLSLSFIYVIKLDKIARIGYITTSCVRYSLYIAPAAAAANITHT